eukprot:TRINITY_DN10236_c0_g5_i1.p1 TRINITY_DN10236_c0_g5~~TRINITY_DN10236_c0_g5_i1.p1  ORF type:complete len:341 (-),score=57.07 TRINITY_DN10236_c0_g5_i1:104-1126(-)
MKSRNRTLPGDIVYVELLPESEWKSKTGFFLDNDMTDLNIFDKVHGNVNSVGLSNDGSVVAGDEKIDVQPTGIVVGVAERISFRRYCGAIDYSSIVEHGEKKQVLFEPVEPSIPKILINTNRLKEFEGKRIVVSLDSWPWTSIYPLGHYVKILGDIGDAGVESEAILIQHGISYEPFNAAVRSCLPPSPWVITEDDLRRRTDLRHLRITSIDPPGCTDIDDALHIRELPNGNYEVGVHIADVSHFVQEDTAIDREARARGNTVYLVNRRIDMLPVELSGDICSLKEKVDRFAFSCMWEMTQSAEIVTTHFCKSIIKSVCSHTYQQAQEKIDDSKRKRTKF